MLATSGGAVLFAGSTVIVALLALAVAQIPFITSLGYACAVGVFTAVLAGLTLLPTIRAVLGGSFILIDDPIIKQFGVGLTVAVALAAFLVLFLAPAMLMLFGKRTWSLPGFLDKIIPDLELEGNNRSIPDGTPDA